MSRPRFEWFSACLLSIAVTSISLTAQQSAATSTSDERPNIVIIFPDNLGLGEVGAYGSVRGAPTPNLDQLAADGIRLTNFNVELSCAMSRAAILTGRYAIRSGAALRRGITLWEVTIADAFKSVGYATAMFGKWHLGGNSPIDSREPKHQGFDEFYGIPQTSNVATRTSQPDFDPATQEAPYIWEGKIGGETRKVKDFNLETRRTIDRECAERGVDFMERSVNAGKPFFLFYPATQIHFPTLAHPDFAGKTGAGDIGDAMSSLDYNTGLILAGIDRLGIRDNTIVIWCTDNGAEKRRPWRGSAGNFRGFYNSAMEGGVRTPCIIRWPGRIPAGSVSNEIVHEMDLFPTLAAAAGEPGIVPTDRAIDGVNQLAFLEGKQAKSNRDTVLFYTRSNVLAAVKWNDWKFFYVYPATEGEAREPLMRLFNMRSDPKEETDVKDANPWARSLMDKLVADFEATTERYPHVVGGTPDPYTPPVRKK